MMNIKINEIVIPDNNPFENCKLDREQYADILTNIVDSYPYGFVLAINNKWGTGKTTFVKMWKRSLELKEYQTIYFNAWENDYEDNPLTAIMGELKKLTKDVNGEKYKSTLKKAAILSRQITPIIAQAIADKYINTKGVREAITSVTKGLTDIFENEVDEYAKRKESILDFKKSISEFVADSSQGKPLIFIIDELDRCRPDYSVSILEQIKHFFSTPNIVFVVSFDKIQLGNAIKGFYGSESIDSEEYLRRFIDLEYSIPDPGAEIYYKYLYEYHDFNSFFNSEVRLRFQKYRNDEKDFLSISSLLFNSRSVPLRQQEKIFALCRLAFRSFDLSHNVNPQLLLLLAFIKIIDYSFYSELKDKNLNIKEVQENYFAIIKSVVSPSTQFKLVLLEAYLLLYYENYLEIDPRIEDNRLLRWDQESKSHVLVLKSSIRPDDERFYNFLMNILREDNNFDLGFYLKRIDLLEKIRS